MDALRALAAVEVSVTCVTLRMMPLEVALLLTAVPNVQFNPSTRTTHSKPLLEYSMDDLYNHPGSVSGLTFD